MRKTDNSTRFRDGTAHFDGTANYHKGCCDDGASANDMTEIVWTGKESTYSDPDAEALKDDLAQSNEHVLIDCKRNQSESGYVRVVLNWQTLFFIC